MSTGTGRRARAETASAETEAAMDAAFRALSHPARRRILDLLRAMPGASVNDLSGHFDVSRIAVMKHLAVLDEAGLVISLKEGRVRALYLNAVPLQRIVERWTDAFGALWAARALDIKRRVEGSRP